MFVPAGGYLLYDPTVLEAEIGSTTRAVVMSPSVKTHDSTSATTFSIAKLLQERAAEHRNGLFAGAVQFRGETLQGIPRAKKATCIVVTGRQRSPTPNSNDPMSDKESHEDSSPGVQTTCAAVSSRELKFGVERILADRHSSTKSEGSTPLDSARRPSSVDTSYSHLCPSFGLHPLDQISLRDPELANKLTYSSATSSLCHCPYDFISPNYGESPLVDQFPVFGSNEASQVILSSSHLCHPTFALLPPHHQVPTPYVTQGVYPTVNSTPQNHSDSRQLHSNIIQTTPLCDTGSSTGKRKRSWSRAVFSNLQRKGLEKRFVIQKYITKPDRRQLAATLGLTDAQVKVWFQNRRMKWRHSKEYREEMAKTGANLSPTAEDGASHCSVNQTEGVKRPKVDEVSTKESNTFSRATDIEHGMQNADCEHERTEIATDPSVTDLTSSFD